jgi:hypothetical protein
LRTQVHELPEFYAVVMDTLARQDRPALLELFAARLIRAQEHLTRPC